MERRATPFRRSITDFFDKEGFWTSVGKGLDIYLILAYPLAIIPHWELLVVMLGFLIMPRTIERAILAYRGGNSMNYTSKFNRNVGVDIDLSEEPTHRDIK